MRGANETHIPAIERVQCFDEPRECGAGIVTQHAAEPSFLPSRPSQQSRQLHVSPGNLVALLVGQPQRSFMLKDVY